MKKDHFKKRANRPISSLESSGTIASHLLKRIPPESYMQELTEALKNPPAIEYSHEILSVLVFRLGQEWLALPTIFFKEITHRRPVHRIPHRYSPLLLGIVNLNGELQLYVALHELLNIEHAKMIQTNPTHYQENRMVAIAKEGELWVFPIDEMDGIYHWNLSLIENVPINVSKSTTNFVKGVMKMDNKSVGLLDDELLFSTLKRNI